MRRNPVSKMSRAPGLPDTSEPPGFGRRVPIEWIFVEPGFNVRKSGFSETEIDMLGRSLQSGGQAQPCLADRQPDGRLRIISGHRRYAAAVKAGLPTLWVEEWGRGEPDIERWVVGVVDNLARRDMTTAEKAEAFESLGKRWAQIHPDVPHAKIDIMIATRCAVSRQIVGQYRRFVQKLIPDILDAWKNSPDLIQVKWLDQVVKLGPDEQKKALDTLRASRMHTELIDPAERGPKYTKAHPTRRKLGTILALLRSRDTTGYAAHLSADRVQGMIEGIEIALGTRKLDKIGSFVDVPSAYGGLPVLGTSPPPEMKSYQGGRADPLDDVPEWGEEDNEG